MKEGKLSLKKEHPYIDQCQLQIITTTRLFCDFVVWGPSDDLHIERIFLGQSFIEEKLNQAEKFWLAILPELLGKWFTRTNTQFPVVNTISPNNDSNEFKDEDSDDRTWFYCKMARGSTMQGCENPLCNIKWFHICL